MDNRLASGRPVSQRTWLLLNELRAAREKREARSSPEELRADAQAKLDAMTYRDKSPVASDELLGKLGATR